MAQLVNGEFDATQYNPGFSGGGQLPPGKYPVVITGDEIKATKDNNGGYLELKLRAIEGSEFVGAVGALRLNLYNSSDTAVRIAHEQLAAIAMVVGVFKFSDTSALHNKPFVVEVVPQTDPKYTQVNAVFDMQGNEPKKAGQVSQQQTGAWGGQQPAQQGAPPQQAAQAPAQAPAQANAWGGQQGAPAQAPAQAKQMPWTRQ